MSNLRRDITKLAKSISGFLSHTHETNFGENARFVYREVDELCGDYNNLKGEKHHSLHYNESRFDYLERNGLMSLYLASMLKVQRNLVVPILEDYSFQYFSDDKRVLNFENLEYVDTLNLDYNFENIYKSGSSYAIGNTDGSITIFKDTSVPVIPNEIFMEFFLDNVDAITVAKLVIDGNFNFGYLKDNLSTYVSVDTLRFEGDVVYLRQPYTISF